MTTTRPASPVLSDEDRTFTAMTFNVFYGTDPNRLRRPFKRGLEMGASLLHVNEAGNPGVRALLRDLGLRTHMHPQQYLLAWDPEVWRATDRYGVSLARTIYYSTSGNPVRTNAAMAELVHRPSKLTLQAMSYHTPAHVQVADKPPNRIKVLREAAETWGRLAADARARGIDAALYAGDDNVDEDQGHGPWDFMLRGATGLTQVQATVGTHGGAGGAPGNPQPRPGGRRIDDFRQYGLRRLGDGEVFATPSDHHAYVQPFRFRRLRADGLAEPRT